MNGSTRRVAARVSKNTPYTALAGQFIWLVCGEQDEALPVFVILTRGAGPGIAVIHDRMPVILPEQVRKAWISDSSDVGALMEKAVDEAAFRAI